MINFEFVIPLSIDALKESFSSKQYVVSYIYTSKEVSQKLYDCIQSFKRAGPQFILDSTCFDLLYSLVVHFNNVDKDVKYKGWQFMLKVLVETTSKLMTLFDGEPLDSSERDMWLNTVKMNTYIACILAEAFEDNYNKPSGDSLQIGKRGKRQPRNDDDLIDWEEGRNQILVQLYSILQAPLNRLWDPPIIEEDFVNLISNVCYKMLSCTTMNLVRLKGTRDSIFQIVGTLVKYHNHGLSCSLKLMQLLQYFDHLVSPIAQGVMLMIESFQVKTILQDFIREIMKLDNTELSKDSSGLRNYSQFLIEVSEKHPELFIPSLPLLISLLNNEAYCLRNCILSVMGSIIKGVLKGERLEERNKVIRDECLGFLEEFIHDVHAFVRSKVLQIWEELIDAQAVPLTQQGTVLKKIIDRLRDKSSSVRKYALHSVIAFLRGNPFAAKLSLEELNGQFEEEVKKLEGMCPGITLEDSSKNVDNNNSQEKWIAIIPKIIKAIYKIVDDDSDSEDFSDNENSDQEAILPPNSSLNEGVELVGASLFSGEYEKAIKILKEVMENFSESEALQAELNENDYTVEALEAYEDMTIQQRHIFVVLHRIFVPYVRMKDTCENPQEKDIEVQKQKLYCCYLRDSIKFAKELHRAIPDVCQLLGSKVMTDVLEAVKFFVAAFEFGLQNAITGVRKMLVLVWSKESSIKEAVVDAYKHLYITVDSPNARSRALHIVTNLTELINGATVGEMASLEEIISTFMASRDIDKHCITLLWERFTKAIPETTEEDAKSSLNLIMMAAKSEPSIISSNINVLISAGLQRENADFQMIKSVCQALSKLAVLKPKTEDQNPPNRLDMDHEMFMLITDILVKGLNNTADVHYCPMANEAITTIYLLAEHPDVLCGNMLKEIANNIKNEEEPVEMKINAAILSRFIFVCGHVAVRQLVHLDTYVFSELKRRNFMKEEQKEQRNMKKKKTKRKSLATSASALKGATEGDIDEEMGVTGAVADDAEADFIRGICEKELVNGDTLLAVIKPMILEVCTNPTKYTDSSLRASACLALAKFMTVSSVCCEQNLQLLFTILEKSSEPVLRANTVIAVGDLTFRFPNTVEPWTPKIYARLRDESQLVKRNTLTVLTHLILNDQIKVKGQISDIARCIVDEDIKLSGLSKLFFTELSRKGNALYNVLPDIISRLSDTEIGIDEVSFRTIISYIFGLIQKDKLLESFIEKLCHRLQASNNPRQWRDISYCLSLLSYSEKGVRKLAENFNCYGDKLHEQEVYTLFCTILALARRQVKTESKACIDELEAKIEESHQKGVEDESVATKATKAANKKKDLKTTVKRKKKLEDSDSEDEFDAQTSHKESKENMAPRRSLRKQV